MPSVATLAYWEAVLLLVGLSGGVFWQMISGKIDLAYLLDGDVKRNGSITTEVSPGRAQAMVVTLYVAGYYLVHVFDHPTEFPSLPSDMLYALGASHAFYLGGKVQSLFPNWLSDFLKRR